MKIPRQSLNISFKCHDPNDSLLYVFEFLQHILKRGRFSNALNVGKEFSSCTYSVYFEGVPILKTNYYYRF